METIAMIGREQYAVSETKNEARHHGLELINRSNVAKRVYRQYSIKLHLREWTLNCDSDIIKTLERCV